MGFLRGHILAALACGLLSEGDRNFGDGGVVCVGNLIADERIFAFSTMVINRGLVPPPIGGGMRIFERERLAKGGRAYRRSGLLFHYPGVLLL